MKALTFLSLFLICARFIHPQNRPATVDFTTPHYDITDLPDDVALEALNVDFGTFQPPEFHFENHQDLYVSPRPKDLKFNTTCMAQYRRCLLDMAPPSPVCAFNHAIKHIDLGYSGYLSAYSYCDVYFDNCRRGYRVWRILDVGVCRFGYDNWQDDVSETRRKNRNGLLGKIIDAVARKKGETQVHKFILRTQDN